MKNWITKKNVLIGAVSGFAISILLNYLREFGISYSVYKLIVEPLFFMSASLSFVAFFLFFVRDQIFSAWLTFAKWWIPLTIVSIIISPTDGSGAFFPAFSSKELTSIWMSGLFVSLSLILIAFKHFTLKGDRETKE